MFPRAGRDSTFMKNPTFFALQVFHCTLLEMIMMMSEILFGLFLRVDLFFEFFYRKYKVLTEQKTVLLSISVGELYNQGQTTKIRV